MNKGVHRPAFPQSTIVTTRPTTDWHALSSEQVAAKLTTDPKNGLNYGEVAQRLTEYGPNEITRRTGRGPLVIFLLQFHQPLIYILLAAAAVTFILREYVDAGVIFGVVLLDAIFGFIQEYRAAKAINALAQSTTVTVTVRRAGQTLRIASAGLVPGDVVMLQSGDQVPADLRLIGVKDMRVTEAALTGESNPIEKIIAVLPADTLLADRKNLAFSSALVTYGQATGIVVATGDHTEVGHIQRLLDTAEELATPLTREIARFSNWLMYIILGIAAITFVVGLLQGHKIIDLFRAAVALAVAAIPEGLPAAVTIVLAVGVWRMATRKSIIRKLPAVETLGSTSVICTDKTGTLTENQMTVQQIWAGGRLWRVSDVGYAPEGTVTAADLTNSSISDAVRECLLCGALCNDSRLFHKDGRWEIDGDPTEAALLVAARKAGLNEMDLTQAFPRLDVVPFESEHQYMASLHNAGPDAHRVVYIKGSVERILERCIGVHQDDIHRLAEEMGAAGLRVLAFARKNLPPQTSALSHANVSHGLTFLGLEGMIDPPRVEAIRAVAACRTAGVRVKMITGDHAATAAAIAGQIDLGYQNRDRGRMEVLTGGQIGAMSDDKLSSAVEEYDVFARVTPEQKLRLVRALQARGHVVAMTGDGVNDAPALKQADIGVAMGITGTDVAKDAADMVLIDDNFASIVAAVEEGRGVFDNLTKFIVWTLPTNLGEALVILLAIIFGITLPILPVQILWINMTTAMLLGTPLTFEPKEPGLMNQPPRDIKQSFLTRTLLVRMLLVGFALVACAFGLYEYELRHGVSAGTDHAEAAARTVAVNVLVMVEAFYLFNCRHLRRSVFGRGFWSNPWTFVGFTGTVLIQCLFTYAPFMNTMFQTAPISAGAWCRILAAAAAVFMLIEVETWWSNRKNDRQRLRLGRSTSEKARI